MVLGDVRVHEIGGDRRNLVKAGFTELPLHIVLFREAKSAMRLQARVGGLP